MTKRFVNALYLLGLYTVFNFVISLGVGFLVNLVWGWVVAIYVAVGLGGVGQVVTLIRFVICLFQNPKPEDQISSGIKWQKIILIVIGVLNFYSIFRLATYYVKLLLKI